MTDQNLAAIPGAHKHKDMTRDEKLAYDDGKKAAEAQKPQDCPFTLKELAIAWNDGWLEAWRKRENESDGDFEGMI